MTVPTPFATGYRLTDGTQLNNVIAYPVWSVQDGVTATNGGTMLTSFKVSFAITNVTSSAAPGAGITLPQALPGAILIVSNRSANDIRIFADGKSTIDGLDGQVGTILAQGITGFFVGVAPKEWILLDLSISSGAGTVTRRQLFSAMLTQGILPQIYDAVEVYSTAWVDWTAAQNVKITDPLGQLIQSQIGLPATVALWVAAESYAP